MAGPARWRCRRTTPRPRESTRATVATVKQIHTRGGRFVVRPTLGRMATARPAPAIWVGRLDPRRDFPVRGAASGTERAIVSVATVHDGSASNRDLANRSKHEPHSFE